MRNELRARVGDKVDALVALYRKLYPGATPADLYFLIASDHQYGGGAMKAAERRSAPGFAPAYLYYWTWESPLEGGKYRAQHTIDIAFAFDNVQASRLTAGAPDAQALADQVSEAFIAFFRTGDPNTPKSKLPAWPRFDAPTDRRWCSLAHPRCVTIRCASNAWRCGRPWASPASRERPARRWLRTARFWSWLTRARLSKGEPNREESKPIVIARTGWKRLRPDVEQLRGYDQVPSSGRAARDH